MIVSGKLTVAEANAFFSVLNEKQMATVLEAFEEVSNKQLCHLEAWWLQWAEAFILSEEQHMSLRSLADSWKDGSTVS
jgi:hypothetical protein